MNASRESRRLVFGTYADLYDRARPSYPDALVDDVVTLVGPGARALDVGCGTGKATRLLAGRGLTGVGVEAHPAMAEVARSTVSAAGGDAWRIDVSGFEDWSPQPGDTPFDLVTSAQAWHWIDPAVRFHKAHDLLRPGGWLAVFWNAHAERQDAADVQRDIDAVYARLAPDVGGLPRPEDAGARLPLPEGVAFDAPLTRDYRWRHDYTTAEWTDLVRTHSNHSTMEPARLDELVAAVAEVVDAHGGTYPHTYVTQLWAARRSV
jgi:SAM-dependent methyltransferase